MATKVDVLYTTSLNVSITERDGVITKVTKWTTGNTAKETERFDNTPKRKR